MSSEGATEFPKVSAIIRSEPISERQVFAMLSTFLASDEPASNHHWDDIYHVSATLAGTKDEKLKLKALKERMHPATEGASHIVFDQADDETKEAEPEAEPTTQVESKEKKARDKAERKAKKAEKKAKKKQKKESKKRKRESKE